MPKLRFPGFEGEWGVFRLSDFADRVTRKNTDNETNLPLTISSKDGLVDQISYFNKTVASKDMSGYYLLKNGEFAYNKSYSVGYDFGSIKRLDRYPMGALSTLYICFMLKKHYSDFIKVYFDSLKWYKEIYKISAEGARNHGLLNMPTDEFFNTKHNLPENVQEQRKIADFINLLNRRIETQQLLLETIKKYKRGVIKSLFERKRIISCKESQWKKCYMGDVITLQSGQDFVPSDYNDNGTGIPYMTGASCIVDDKTVVSRWTTKPRCMAYKDDTLLVCKGSGSGAVVKLTQKEAHIARQFMALQCNSAITKDFCFYLTLYLSNRIKQAATGLIEGIDRKTVLNQEIMLPSIDEQNKIANFLSNYDNIIYAHKTYLAYINEIKKHLLQQLFI